MRMVHENMQSHPMFSTLTRARYKMLNQAHTIRLTARATGSHTEGAWRNPGGPSAIHSIKVSDIAFASDTYEISTCIAQLFALY